MFSSRSFMVSYLTFRSSIHFEFIFVHGIREFSNFILLYVAVLFSQHHLLKRLSFLHCIFLPHLSKIDCRCSSFLNGFQVIFSHINYDALYFSRIYVSKRFQCTPFHSVFLLTFVFSMLYSSLTKNVAKLNLFKVPIPSIFSLLLLITDHIIIIHIL